MFKRYINNSRLPHDLETEKVVPISKKNPKEDSKIFKISYRPVCILPNISTI